MPILIDSNVLIDVLHGRSTATDYLLRIDASVEHGPERHARSDGGAWRRS